MNSSDVNQNENNDEFDVYIYVLCVTYNSPLTVANLNILPATRLPPQALLLFKYSTGNKVVSSRSEPTSLGLKFDLQFGRACNALFGEQQ